MLDSAEDNKRVKPLTRFHSFIVDIVQSFLVINNQIKK